MSICLTGGKQREKVWVSWGQVTHDGWWAMQMVWVLYAETRAFLGLAYYPTTPPPPFNPTPSANTWTVVKVSVI